MDWVHCNSCYLQPGDKKGKKFQLTSCGHIYCDECIKSSVVDKCKICGSNCTMVALEAEMRADVQQFFDDPGCALKKILRVIEFQEGHRQRLTSQRRLLSAKYKSAKEEIYKLRKKLEELQKEVMLLRQRCVTNTPGGSNIFHHPSPPTVWNSTPKQDSAHSKLSPLAMPSPANSEGWVTPNRLTLKRTPSPSNRHQSHLYLSQGIAKQRKPPVNTPSPMSKKITSYNKIMDLKSSGPSNMNHLRGNLRSCRENSTHPGTPTTPVSYSGMRANAGSYYRDHLSSPSPRSMSCSLRDSTPISSGSLLSNLKLTSPN